MEGDRSRHVNRAGADTGRGNERRDQPDRLDWAACFAGPPPHRHPRFDEVFWILEGTASLSLGDRTVVADAGEGVYGPGDVVHTFSNPSECVLRILISLAPGGFERYFEELADLLTNGPPGPDALDALWSRYGLLPAPSQPAAALANR